MRAFYRSELQGVNNNAHEWYSFGVEIEVQEHFAHVMVQHECRLVDNAQGIE